MNRPARSIAPVPGTTSPRGLGRLHPATGLVMLAVVSTQIGASLAKSLLGEIGAMETGALRLAFAAILLWVAWRPNILGFSKAAYRDAIWFGIALGTMNLTFYEALSRIPLGVAVTLEFVGPLGIALIGSRKPSDVLWALVAVAGVLLLAPWTGARFNSVGVLCALLAGAAWAAYILLSARVGKQIPGWGGLTIAMSVGAVIAIPAAGIAGPGLGAMTFDRLGRGLAVACLSSALPYGLELEALRRLPARAFGLLMSTEPAVAALSGLVFLGEHLSLRAVIAIVLISIATVASKTR